MGRTKKEQKTLFDFEKQCEEESAQALIRRIRLEKENAEDKGEIKKRKRLSKIEEDEIPFDIPEKWEWVRLYDLADACPLPFADGPFGSNLKQEHYTKKHEVRIIQLSNIGDNGWKDTNVRYTTFEHLKTIERSEVKPGNIVIAKMMPAGRAIIVPEGEEKYVLSSDAIKFVPSPYLEKKYLYYVINSRVFREQVYSEVCGTTRVRTSLQKIIQYLIPIPPLSEQKRIVSRIESLFSRLDEARAKAREVIDGFELWKSAILHKAFTGRLVEQRPEEGTGEELFREIQKEKQRLVKEGKIKKEKALPEIKEDEIPFEIPVGWKWVRLGEIGSYKKGPFGSALKKSIFVPKGKETVKVYEQKNAIYKNVELGDYYITRQYFETNMKGFEVHPGDVIVSCAGTIGETFVLPEGIEQGIINQALMRMLVFNPTNVPYFLFFFDFALKGNAKNNSRGSAIKNIPPFEVFKNFLVPLPPLSEQKRIVSKIESLFSRMEGAVDKAKSVVEQIDAIKKSILEKAFRGELGTNDPTEESALALLKSAN